MKAVTRATRLTCCGDWMRPTYWLDCVTGWRTTLTTPTAVGGGACCADAGATASRAPAMSSGRVRRKLRILALLTGRPACYRNGTVSFSIDGFERRHKRRRLRQ